MTAAPPLPTGLLIGDEWVHHTADGSYQHVNPATGLVQAEFPVAGAAEVDAAVAAARAALPVYRAWSAAQRRRALQRLAALMREHSAEFAALGTAESGLLTAVASGVAGHAADWFEYYAGWTDKIGGSVSPAAGLNYTLHEPVGVVAVLLTWNSPTAMIGTKMAAVLAAGCTIVLKPPELAPFGSVLFGRLCLEAGLPPGTVNIITGTGAAGDALVRHPGVDKITFTGGPETARRIQEASAASLTPCLFELGGKSPNIVFADADLDAAALHAALGVVRLSGQVCHAPTRLLVQDSVYDEVLDAVAGHLAAVRVGDPLDPSSEMGPVIGQRSYDRVLAAVETARAAHAGEFVMGGAAAGLGSGFYLRPTLFSEVDPASELAREELFGPVLAATRFTDEAHAVALANDSPYGLAAHLHTNDLSQAHRLARDLDTGNIAINGGLAYAGPAAPFGGFKASGHGKEGGREGIEEFLRVKNVNIRIN
ncbi:aldehyde dehydrogenase family protein [Pseudofrankia asymbiotica]|uniref:Aldehyde dehydrogenase domain-containing protein n=1 Tax=Pseudofrankia asymbiotica TaxID=1834516 RepID=A0A1V2IEU8_9ACTN|nr:aldehyde dehydrogenase family protein [Pseudofrankia asymbiotica]ONH31723.1 hypothetical protein BL253_08680 [Pseudofrankia asymbiotica]